MQQDERFGATGFALPAAPRYPVTVHGAIITAARRDPARLALISDEGMLTYGELDAISDRLARGLLERLGLQHGDRVGVLCDQSPRFYHCALAISRAGLVIVPIPARSTARELTYFAEHSGMRALLVADGLADRVSDALDELVSDGVQVLRWTTGSPSVTELVDGAGGGPSLCAEDDELPFFIAYTSGTTGAPKGAVVSQRARALLMLMLGQEYGCYAASDRHLVTTPIYHGAGMTRALAPLMSGGSVVLHPKFDPQRAAAALDDASITAAFMVPTMYAAMQQHAPGKPVDVTGRLTILSNAAALPEQLKEYLLGRWPGLRLFEIYGSTEAGTVTSLRPEDQLRKHRCVGLPLAMTDVRLLDADGTEVADGEIGELFARSPFLFSGYLGDPTATVAAMNDGYVSSGDLARRDEEGFLYIVGRRSELIVSGGVNVYPREVEEVLRDHPSIADAAVFGVPDPHWGEAVHAAVTLTPGAADIEIDSVLTHCRRELAPTKVPKRLTVRAELPRTPTGKVIKRTLIDEVTGAEHTAAGGQA